MKNGKKLVYSGIKFRKFLQNKGITYKDASQELGLDKNTIGKAVRGGNLNVSVLLSIANHWDFPIADFFSLVNPKICEGDYFIRTKHYRNLSEERYNSVAEEPKNYKNLKKLSTEELALKESKQNEIELLNGLIYNYQRRINLLEQELEQLEEGEL